MDGGVMVASGGDEKHEYEEWKRGIIEINEDLDHREQESTQIKKDLFWFKDKCAYLEKQNKDLRDEIDSIKRSQDVGTGS